MKTRFSTLDVMAVVPHLKAKLDGMRVTQVYDCDHKTYLFKLSRTANQSNSEQSVKAVLLIESGVRVHSTQYEWPKNSNPSGFTMKLRKHLKNKRLESITQLGVDRVIDLQFGSNEAAYHVILELYDRGNIVITDYQYVILNILRPRKIGSDEDVNLVVREKYPIDSAISQPKADHLTADVIADIIDKSKDGDNLRKILNPHTIYGSALIEHCLTVHAINDFKLNKKTVDVNIIEKALNDANKIMADISSLSKGFIVQKVEKRVGEPNTDVISYVEFHPFLFNQHKNNKDPKLGYIEMPSFDKAVDLFFSSIESQKIDSKALQMEREAMKKLENIKKDHQKRIEGLTKVQEADVRKAELIESNCDLVEKALLVIRSAIANQFSWKAIQELIDDAKAQRDPIATRITSLKLNKNNFTIKLSDPYEDDNAFELIDIDIDLSAHANARKYYDRKRTAAKKEQKTIESSAKAFKNAEKKAMQTLKEVAVKTNITKARKILWFEKFLWFISSDNYIVIAGRDAQQNEMIVKRYMKPGDLYVHADLHGATTVVIKNSNPLLPIPPKTLNEAGDMAICNSAAWEAKIITSAWWVYPNQVSKTAPSGEYLSVGSFMIRGKKNYLSLSHLVMGFGFIFKLDEESTIRHVNERKRSNTIGSESSLTNASNIEEEIEIPCASDTQESDSDGDSIKFPDTRPKLIIDTNVEQSNVLETNLEINESVDNDNTVIINSKEPRKKQISKSSKINSNKNNTFVNKEPTISESDAQPGKSQKLKRGQRSKLKKIKEKYKDQDEEERVLRMAILGHNNSKKNQTSKSSQTNDRTIENNIKQNSKFTTDKNEIKDSEKLLENSRVDKQIKKENLELNTNESAINNENIDNEIKGEHQEEEADDDEIVGRSDDITIIDSLTGNPLSEDNLLFAIPVCGPYSAMHDYKYKVKVLPGMSRRGKAAKTALQLFLRDKTAVQREKDVLKAIKDQDISKNIPSKIKITASNLSAVKSKK